jgi:hypothetical protein
MALLEESKRRLGLQTYVPWNQVSAFQLVRGLEGNC